MSRKLKLICRILKNPRTVLRLTEAEGLLENEGAEFKRIRGSHHRYKYKGAPITFQVHNRRLHPDATKDFINILELREKYEDDCEQNIKDKR